jgi:hypothetical protein
MFCLRAYTWKSVRTAARFVCANFRFVAVIPALFPCSPDPGNV